MLYLVQFSRLTYTERRSQSYKKEAVATVAVSDYGVDAARDYAEAAFLRRPDLRGHVSCYAVSDLTPKNGRLAPEQPFCLGNDHSGCRNFYRNY